METILDEKYILDLAKLLPIIRAKMKISQLDFAGLIGIGRQTLINIESGRAKMRKDTFISIIFILSLNEEVSKMVTQLGIDINIIKNNLKELINISATKIWRDKLWSDNCNAEMASSVKGPVPLPVGVKNNCSCPKCGSKNIMGALITITADEDDPNIVCLDCGYWFD